MNIYVCRGLPASGKTTMAKAFATQLLDNPSRLNRRDLHMSMYGKVDPKNIKNVEAIWETIFRLHVRTNRSIILDEYHLNPEEINNIRRLAQFWCRAYKQKVDMHYWCFRTSLATCIKRDQKREDMVGDFFIADMAQRYNWVTDPNPLTLWEQFKALFKKPTQGEKTA